VGPLRFLHLLAITALLLPTALAANDWPQPRFDETHQGSVPSNLNSEFGPFTSRWWNNLSIPGPVSAAAIREDIVYLGDASGKIWAIDRESGGTIWFNTTGSSRVSGAAVGQDFVYVTSEGGSLHSYNRKTGRLETGYPLNVGKTFSGPLLHEDILYVGSTDGSVKSYFASSQQPRWSFSTSGTFGNATTGQINCASGSIDGTPVLFESWILFGATNKCFFAIKKSSFGSIDPAKGDLVWWFQAQDSIRTTPAIDRVNRRVIFGDTSGNVYAIPLTSVNKATEAWRFVEPTVNGTSSEFKAAPTIVGDKVVVAALNGNVRALSLASGTSAWVRNVNGRVVGSPAAANGHILVGSFDRNMYMLSAADGTVKDTRLALAEVDSSPAISGTQAVWSDQMGNLYAFGGSKPPRADLLVDSVSASLTRTQTGTISFNVKSVGALPAENSTLTITLGGAKVGEIAIPPLALGAGHSGAISVTPSNGGEQTIVVFVDATRVVKESDESNNIKTVKIQVAEPPEPVDPAATESSAGGPAPTGALLIAAVLVGAFLVSRRRRHA
jgi:eukaryotic-like serine/threonine-protein kinase